MERHLIPPRGPAGSFSAPSRKVMRARPSHPLPKGWYQATAENGSSYYYDASGNRQWQRPGQSADATSMGKMNPVLSPYWNSRERRRSGLDDRTSSMHLTQHSISKHNQADLPPAFLNVPPHAADLHNSSTGEMAATSRTGSFPSSNVLPHVEMHSRSPTPGHHYSRYPSYPLNRHQHQQRVPIIQSMLANKPPHVPPTLPPATSSYKPSNLREDSETSLGQGSTPRRQYRGYHAPGTQFRTFQGLGEKRRRASQSSTAMSEMHSRPTMPAYSERAAGLGFQPDLPAMDKDGERVTYIEEAPDQDRQWYHRQLTGHDPPSPYGKSYEHDEETDDSGKSDIAPERILERDRQFKQELERRPREVNSKPIKRPYSGSPQHALLRDHKGAAADFSEDYATNEARDLEQRALGFGRQEGEEPTRNDKNNPDGLHRKKMKYTISEDLTGDRSRRLKAKYFALECSQSSSVYALRR